MRKLEMLKVAWENSSEVLLGIAGLSLVVGMILGALLAS